MLRLASIYLLCLFIHLDCQGSLAACQDNVQKVCLLSDPANQCASYCLSAFGAKVDTIQRSLDTELHSQLVTAKEGLERRLNMTKEHLMAANSEAGDKFQALQTQMKNQYQEIEDSLRKTSTQEDLGAAVNRTEGQLLAVGVDMKRQLLDFRSKVEEQHTELQETASRTVTKGDFETEMQAVQMRMFEQMQTLQSKLCGQHREIQDSLRQTNTHEQFEARLNQTDAKLQLLQSKMEDHQVAIQNCLQELLAKVEGQQAAFKDSLLETLQTKTNVQIIPPKFEQIGSRFFYIEQKVQQNWFAASATCRQMGGHLAALRNQGELKALKAKLPPQSVQWLGINDREEEGKFVSEASGNPATFLKWAEEEPNNLNNNENCVALLNGSMNDDNCLLPHHFICQAGSEV
ncbi:low affinity immunoglobulin epsilon Fc receptor-like [Drosophila elegans]|uniref:low affinity immunoglobulin epsilon Fc receptor-like n=1 Tax=Drosophila elegans TaxID=30023 RepID=UPI0007E5F1BA|nr:low affinity immunoglobulin epsilon Fc receptor-like [Drosophila elegans]